MIVMTCANGSDSDRDRDAGAGRASQKAKPEPHPLADNLLLEGSFVFAGKRFPHRLDFQEFAQQRSAALNIERSIGSERLSRHLSLESNPNHPAPKGKRRLVCFGVHLARNIHRNLLRFLQLHDRPIFIDDLPFPIA